jgi:hypothetical protein
MSRRLWTVLPGAVLIVASCSTSRPAPTAPGQPSAAAASPAPAPDRAPASPAVTSAPTEPTASSPATLSMTPSRPHQDILKLKQAGLSDEFILNKVRTDNVPYSLTTADIVELRTAGISETVIEAMMKSGQPPASASGTEVARKAEFSGFARVGKGFLVFGTSARKVGRLVVDGENVSWFDSEDPKRNFSIYVRNIREVFNTCVLRPTQNLCLEFGFVTHTGEEYRFRDPGWKNGENRLVTEATTYFRQAFPTLFFSQRAVSEM